MVRLGRLENRNTGDDLELLGFLINVRPRVVIGTQIRNIVELETVFLRDYSFPKESLQSCLNEHRRQHFRNVESFLRYEKNQLNPGND